MLAGKLVGSQIQRADHDLVTVEGAHYLAVGRGVVLFGRLGAAAQIKEFSAIEPDPVGSPLGAMLDFFREFDVAQKQDTDLVAGDRRLLPERLQTREDRFGPRLGV